jgi:hypothetical protein
MAKWIGIAALAAGGVAAVYITDDSDNNLPYGNTDWLEAVDGVSTALAVIPDENESEPEVTDCASDGEARRYYYTYPDSDEDAELEPGAEDDEPGEE